MTKRKPAASLVILNIPELAGKPPEWNEVQASFLNRDQNLIVKTLILLLIGQMASARKSKESDPRMPSDQCKYHDGAASVADETLDWILKLLRGDGDKLPDYVKRLFGQPDKADKKA